MRIVSISFAVVCINFIQVLYGSTEYIASVTTGHKLRHLQGLSGALLNLLGNTAGSTTNVLHTGVSQAGSAIQTSINSGAGVARSVRQAAAEIASGLGEAAGATTGSVVHSTAPLVRGSLQPLTQWAAPIHKVFRNALRGTFNIGSWLLGF